MKIILTLVILFCMMIVGCNEKSKVKTAPWSDTEVERMENDEIKSVPILVLPF